MPSLTGKSFEMVITDEWLNLFKELGDGFVDLNGAAQHFGKTLMAKPLFKFGPLTISDPKYPAADVTVEEIEHGKHSPMNPNPAAGRSRTYVVVAGGKRSHPISNSITAETRARALHEAMIAALKADEAAERSRIPNWGAF